ncbi:hypothetical protein PMIN01_02663 [Paraphaeosphaeria minitans]|uniref:Uncharacterized protein n=1 Tax=Paraphaeosphaeria minitans TaxID=565426 RepID=A0A9P6GR53_9PLEO|nr:hypothetical protein PMIN01_02663 [Paraphaeosphaeria minitans]
MLCQRIACVTTWTFSVPALTPLPRGSYLAQALFVSTESVLQAVLVAPFEARGRVPIVSERVGMIPSSKTALSSVQRAKTLPRYLPLLTAIPKTKVPFVIPLHTWRECRLEAMERSIDPPSLPPHFAVLMAMGKRDVEPPTSDVCPILASSCVVEWMYRLSRDANEPQVDRDVSQ